MAGLPGYKRRWHKNVVLIDRTGGVPVLDARREAEHYLRVFRCPRRAFDELVKDAGPWPRHVLRRAAGMILRREVEVGGPAQ